MKKLLQKIVQMIVICCLISAPSITSAQDRESAAKLCKGVGGIATIVGALGWLVSAGSEGSCRLQQGACTSDRTVCEFRRVCSGRSEDGENVELFRGMTLAGAGVMGLGFILGKKNAFSESKRFQVRSIPNGIAIEGDGLSFSAAANGRVRLEKRWEF